MHEVDRGNGVSVGGHKNSLVMVVVVAVVGVGHDSIGRAVTAGACAGSVAIVMRLAVLGVKIVPAWVIHELAVAAGAKVAGFVQVVVDTGVVVAVVGAVSVVARWLVFDDTARVVEVVIGSLHLRLCYWVHIIASYA